MSGDRDKNALSPRLIALIPRIDLHTGYHGAIINDPPHGCEFVVADVEHVFLLDNDDRSPYESPHFGEFLQAPSPDEIVHTARWPVLGARRWVTDTDDLLYPIMCGRSAYDPDFRSLLRTGDSEFRSKLQRRSRNMISAYMHSSCRAILLRGQPRLSFETAKEWFEFLSLAQEGRELLEKVTVVRPAQKAACREIVERKWMSGRPFRVLFCGRDFEVKNGLLTLQLMSRLRATFPQAECVYVGPIPSDVVGAYPHLMQNLLHFEELDHISTLEAMREAHVLVHPSHFDSIGIVMLEAMGAGMAVIAARGKGIDYVDDLFGSGGALLVDRDKVPFEQEFAAFETFLLSLAARPELAHAMGIRNYALVSEGDYSISRQNRILSEVYCLAEQSSAVPLKLSDLPHTEGCKIVRMSSRDVKHSERVFRRENDLLRTGHLSVTV